MDAVTSSQLVHIILRALNRVDPRLVGHGERVAAIVYHMLRLRPDLPQQERSALYIMALLHDIGAYKTEEIDDLMKFESAGVWEHSAYGYLFLKKLSPLGDFALPVLYHHLPYFRYNLAEDSLRDDDYAGLLYLADRVDMITLQQGADACSAIVARNRGTLFCPAWVDLFFEADRQFGILEQLTCKSCTQAFNALADELEIAEDDIRQYLAMVSYSIDFRSEFMVLHTVTTVSVSQVIGARMGLDAATQELLYFGALLHDVGKVACSVEILEKPGKLTPEEMDLMKQHVVVTREILSGLIDPAVLEIAARHHEKLDGSGYPQGLTADVLTCPERIAAVADIVSALIRQRSYKTAFDKQTTMGILSKMKDSGQICSSVTDVVLEHFDEIVLAAERFGSRITAAYNSIRRSYISLLARLPITIPDEA